MIGHFIYLIKRIKIILLLLLLGYTPALANTCPKENLKPIPKCLSWEYGPVAGLIISNKCSFSINYEVTITDEKNGAGTVKPDEEVLFGLSIPLEKMKKVYCCSNESRCKQ